MKMSDLKYMIDDYTDGYNDTYDFYIDEDDNFTFYDDEFLLDASDNEVSDEDDFDKQYDYYYSKLDDDLDYHAKIKSRNLLDYLKESCEKGTRFVTWHSEYKLNDDNDYDMLHELEHTIQFVLGVNAYGIEDLNNGLREYGYPYTIIKINEQGYHYFYKVERV